MPTARVQATRITPSRSSRTEIIWTGDGRKLSVLDLVPVEQEAFEYVGFLKVQPA
jgi:hypothetical protein